jgi:hypothetical protein
MSNEIQKRANLGLEDWRRTWLSCSRLDWSGLLGGQVKRIARSETSADVTIVMTPLARFCRQLTLTGVFEPGEQRETWGLAKKGGPGHRYAYGSKLYTVARRSVLVPSL